jgi:hypothetical protein
MAWITYEQRTAALKRAVEAKAAETDLAADPEAFYNQLELGLLPDDELAEWVADLITRSSSELPATPPSSYNMSDAYQIRSLRWLMNNAETVADKELARNRYIITLFDLWRKHVALTGEMYFKDLREEIEERYQAMQEGLS